MDNLQILVSSATYKAGDCSGKVKVVTDETRKEKLKGIIELLGLPIEVITEKEALEEIKKLHDSLLAEEQTKSSEKKTEEEK